MLKIYLTNLGKYNEGELVGKWVDLEDYEDLDDLEESGCFEEIGIGSERWDGTVYEEWFVTDYDTDIPGLGHDEYPDLKELIKIANRWEGLDDDERLAVKAYLEHINNNLDDALEWADDGWLDNYYIHHGMHSIEELMEEDYKTGVILVNLPKEYVKFIDWKAVAEHYGDNLYEIKPGTWIEILEW